MTPQQLIENYLAGSGITISNATCNGSVSAISSNQVGYYNTTGTAFTQLKLDAGILMTTGRADIAIGPNNSPDAGDVTTYGGDPDLDVIAQETTYDACVMEFDFIPRCDTVSFRYVFGSEEFYEFCGESINDAFGFFLMGPGITGPFSNNSINLALMPGTSNYVIINNVCSDPLSNWNNAGGTWYQYDGLTHVFTAWHLVTPYSTYHIKLAIADAHDRGHDSGVFLEKNSFSSGPGIQISNTCSNPAVPPFAIEGCNNVIVSFKVAQTVSQPVLTIGFTISGTAMNGTDYTTIPSYVSIPGGEDSAAVVIQPLIDGLAEGTETVILQVDQASCSGTQSFSDTIYIHDYNPFSMSLGNDMTICRGDTAEIRVVVSGGLQPFTYNWNPPSGNDSLISVAPPTGPNTFIASVTDACNSLVTDTVVVNVNPLPSLTTQPLSGTICSGDTTQIFLTADVSSAGFSWRGTTLSGEVSGYADGSGTLISQVLINNQAMPGIVDYHIIITSPGCDSSSADFLVTVNPGLKGAKAKYLKLPAGGLAELHAGGGYNHYLWSNGSTDSIITVNSKGMYWVRLTNDFGCSTIDTVYVDELGLLIPGAFSPNGDGKNDVFRVLGLSSDAAFQMDVFDRWGQKVFSSDNVSTGWDGTMNGAAVPEGVFAWVVRLKANDTSGLNSSGQVYRGTVTLVR